MSKNPIFKKPHLRTALNLQEKLYSTINEGNKIPLDSDFSLLLLTFLRWKTKKKSSCKFSEMLGKREESLFNEMKIK